jgi:uncharacterized protein (UPF0333 family)
MNKLIGAVLIIASLAIAYVGINKISQSTESVSVLGVKIEASDNSGKTEGFLFLGLAIVLLAGGIYTVNKPKG